MEGKKYKNLRAQGIRTNATSLENQRGGDLWAMARAKHVSKLLLRM
jgi:hypothetical protein